MGLEVCERNEFAEVRLELEEVSCILLGGLDRQAAAQTGIAFRRLAEFHMRAEIRNGGRIVVDDPPNASIDGGRSRLGTLAWAASRELVARMAVAHR
jgi:hypothetical protein